MTPNDTTPTPPESPGHKPMRMDGQQARLRLLDAGLTLFADKGFANTSIREIAQAAQVNIASISYYFGDKEGLYRAVYTDPRHNILDANAILQAGGDIRNTLRVLLTGLTDPLKQGDLMQLCVKLHFREMLQPTGIWQEDIEHNIKPSLQALMQALCQHLKLAQADDDVHRLAFSILSLATMLHIGHDVISNIRPALIASAPAIDLYVERLLTYAMAMVDAETQRRALATEAPAALRKIAHKATEQTQ